MLKHLRASLWLLGLTLLLCSILYPLVLLLVGQTIFHHQANGSLVPGSDGKPVGSWLIAQGFSGDRYFQPRPSAVSHNGAGSGGSNWATSNYLLRERVARQLGPIVKYGGGPKAGQPVGPDVEQWVREHPEVVARWAKQHPGAAQRWLDADKGNVELVALWKKAAAREGPPTEDDVVAYFSAPSPVAYPPEMQGHVQRLFFDMWRQEHPQAELEPVPADMVTASGSGLDPHITLKSALYQSSRVAGVWASETKRDPAGVRQEIEELVRQKASAPLGGLAGVELINVLEINLALRERHAKQARR